MKNAVEIAEKHIGNIQQKGAADGQRRAEILAGSRPFKELRGLPNVSAMEEYLVSFATAFQSEITRSETELSEAFKARTASRGGSGHPERIAQEEAVSDGATDGTEDLASA